MPAELFELQIFSALVENIIWEHNTNFARKMAGGYKK
jgi:hypothetical protein